jgi:hypothetical protein
MGVRAENRRIRQMERELGYDDEFIGPVGVFYPEDFGKDEEQEDDDGHNRNRPRDR